MSLKPAAPTVEGSGIWRDTVERGEMVLEVRGPGTLVPENPRWISAVTAGRVEKIHLLPGVNVEAQTVILELSNPDVEIQTLNADRQLTDAESQLVQLRTNLNNNRLNQASAVAAIRQEYLDARRRAEAGAELLRRGLIVPLDQQQAQDRADALQERVRLEEERLKMLQSPDGAEKVRKNREFMKWVQEQMAGGADKAGEAAA